MKALTRLGQRRYPVRGGYTTEQARELALLSRSLGRQIGLVIDRQGKVDMVIVGDPASILIPELPRGRGGSGRLRGIRLMHTHLSPDGLSQEDLMDMLFLRLDSVSVLTVNDYGDPVSFQSGHLLPPNADSTPYRVHPPTAWDRVELDFNAEAESLEEELGRVLSEASEAGDSPRAVLVSVSALPRATQEMHIEELCELARSAGIVVTGVGEFYTKDVARDMVFAANQAGCAFLGRPLVEATGSMRNFRVQAQIGGVDERTAFRAAVTKLIERLDGWQEPPPIRHVLALHASQRSTSNTLAFWELVREGLPETIEVEEIGLRNGIVPDCNGCSYTACLHFGEQGSCFYGGPMVEEVYPAVRRCDALVMLCANYNDALSANLTACVNRLTALFRQQRFYDKRLFGLIVSGYSGGDLLARQLISALNMNKSFFLPPHFCLLETANERGSLIRLPGIARRAHEFAAQLSRS